MAAAAAAITSSMAWPALHAVAFAAFGGYTHDYVCASGELIESGLACQ